MVNKKVQRIKLIIAIMVVLVTAIIVGIRIYIYNKNGEKNMPFQVKELIIVSTARKYEGETGAPAESNGSIWNFDVVQNNDMYIEIKNNNAKEYEKIKNVKMSNIQITQNPAKGSIKVYMPNSVDGARYTYTNEFEVKDSLTYRGSEENSYKDLRINRNGGKLSMSFANKDLGKYSSGEDTEVTYDGKMLAKMGLTDEDLKFKIAFDLTIELEDGKAYVGRIEAEVNCEGLVENGTTQIDIKDFSNVVFKRA